MEFDGIYPLVMTNIWKMAIEIVSFPMTNGDVPSLCKRLPEGVVVRISHDFMVI